MSGGAAEGRLVELLWMELALTWVAVALGSVSSPVGHLVLVAEAPRAGVQVPSQELDARLRVAATSTSQKPELPPHPPSAASPSCVRGEAFVGAAAWAPPLLRLAASAQMRPEAAPALGAAVRRQQQPGAEVAAAPGTDAPRRGSEASGPLDPGKASLWAARASTPLGTVVAAGSLLLPPAVWRWRGGLLPLKQPNFSSPLAAA